MAQKKKKSPLEHRRRATAVPLTLAEQARERLDEMIATLELPPESLWSEAQLSELLKIGRTPVREAVQKLASAQLVTILPRHGIKISAVNVQTQLLVLELRRELERLVASRAARRATTDEKSQLPAMAKAIEDASRTRDVLAYIKGSYAVARFLAQCARNPFVTDMLSPFLTFSARFYYVYQAQVDDLPTAGKLRAAVIRAVAMGDEAAAAAKSDLLMDYIDRMTRDLIMRAF
ncbi:MAG: GntR family transcriptional regulator [Burkholderiales bacterium]|nr:GntR family transcriptional regulator [Burkholderiales bacterium]